MILASPFRSHTNLATNLSELASARVTYHTTPQSGSCWGRTCFTHVDVRRQEGIGPFQPCLGVFRARGASGAGSHPTAIGRKSLLRTRRGWQAYTHPNRGDSPGFPRGWPHAVTRAESVYASIDHLPCPGHRHRQHGVCPRHLSTARGPRRVAKRAVRAPGSRQLAARQAKMRWREVAAQVPRRNGHVASSLSGH